MLIESDELQVTLEQMGRLLAALEDLRDNVLPKNPTLFAAMAEGPLDHLARLRAELERHSEVLKMAG